MDRTVIRLASQLWHVAYRTSVGYGFKFLSGRGLGGDNLSKNPTLISIVMICLFCSGVGSTVHISRGFAMFLVLGIFSLARRAFLEKRPRISDLALRKKNQNDTRESGRRNPDKLYRDHELEIHLTPSKVRISAKIVNTRELNVGKYGSEDCEDSYIIYLEKFNNTISSAHKSTMSQLHLPLGLDSTIPARGCCMGK